MVSPTDHDTAAIMDRHMRGCATSHSLNGCYPRLFPKGYCPRLSPVRERGASLIEMIAYIAIFAVMVNLCLGVFIKSSRMSALGTGILDRMQALREIRQEFTESVMLADAVVPAIGDYRTGADLLVLRTNGMEGAARYVVFGRLDDARRLSRLVLAKTDTGLEVERLRTFPLDLDVVTFAYDSEAPEQARLVSLHVDILDASGKGTAPAGQTFRGAVRARGSAPESEGGQ
jgi:hypothetical protein